jgi:hypothetical protein
MIAAPRAVYETDPNVRGDLIRLIIDARSGYEKLCGAPPVCIHVSAGIAAVLAARGFKEGTLVAGMKIITRIGEPTDEALCSRDEKLFAPVPVVAPVATASPAKTKRAAAK